LEIEIAAAIRATKTLSHRNTSATSRGSGYVHFARRTFSTRPNSHPVHEWSGFGLGGGATSRSDAQGIKAFVVVYSAFPSLGCLG
jgi:hypothetical protein